LQGRWLSGWESIVISEGLQSMYRLSN
jgi:hypothetical protein